jgi:putative ATP-dependent endonuclease of OLD family
LTSLIKVAQNLGIEWHLLSDGDEAGQHYREMARPFFDPEEQARRITILAERDIEHCFWQHGFANIYKKAAFPNAKSAPKGNPKSTILQAVGRTSKPYLALQILEAVAELGPGRVPAVLRRAIETAIDLARHSS